MVSDKQKAVVLRTLEAHGMALNDAMRAEVSAALDENPAHSLAALKLIALSVAPQAQQDAFRSDMLAALGAAMRKLLRGDLEKPALRGVPAPAEPSWLLKFDVRSLDPRAV